MTTDTILHKYLRHLRRIGADNVSNGFRHIDACELVLRLALEELADAMQAQSAEVAELRSQLAQLDADNAALIQQHGELTKEIDRLHAEGRKRIRAITNGDSEAVL